MSQRTLPVRALSLVLASALCSNIFIPQYVYAQEQSSLPLASGAFINQSDLDEINRQIIKKNLELLRFNTEFRDHYMAPNKNKQRRLKFYDAAGGAIANAGDITLMSQFWRYWKNPGAALANRGRLQAGAVVVMVAYLTLGGLYLGEGMYDLYSDYKGKKQKWDAKSVREKGLSFKHELDELLEKRQRLISSAGANGQADILTAEGRVLSGIRDLGLVEFSRLYIDSRKRHTARDITTVGTIAVCATGAFIGALGVIKGLRDVNLKKVGGGGIGFLISGGTLIAAPALIHGGAAATGQISKAKLQEILAKAETKTVETLSRDVEQLSTMLATNRDDSENSLSKVYKVFAEMLKERQAYLDKDRKDQKKEMIESFISYAARGGPQIAFGTMLCKAGYHYNHEPARALRAVAQGATANEVSWGIWMADVLQKSVRNEVKFHQEASKGNSAPFAVNNDKLVQVETTMK